MRRMPVKTMFLLVEAVAAVSMLALSFLLSNLTGQGWVLLAGALLTACALRVSHDSKWTAEALFNLLDNAVKYTPAGGKISVSVERWEMYVKLDVTDTGKGIPESRQAAIFRRFYREEEVHDQPGVGIGLYLAREIVTRQGGYIKVTSEVGRGSTFSVFLPRR